ncbi:MAG: NYN domain-containing protein [Patescibacteria group bacterium]|nr:NYN domain-containing protein [Patescibacteria group bacterium]MDE2438527.1 NYN domain-containing protein [Patescibacteria group bacterium]
MSVIKYGDQRVGVLIDVQNLYHSAKNLYNARVNFKELLNAATAKRRLVRAFGYVVKSDIPAGEASFFDALEKSGLELKMKDLQIFPGGAKKADWDVGMAVDAIRIAPSLDTVVLITGDGDFIPLVEYLKNIGKQVEVIAFGKSASGKLREAADEFIDLGEDPSRFLLTIHKRARRYRTQEQ